MAEETTLTDRRNFLRLFAGAPLLLAPGLSPTSRDDRLSGSLPLAQAASDLPGQGTGTLIDSPADAINVMDFEKVARAKLPPAHFGYLATGVDDDATLRANREGFGRWAIRPRRLVDVRAVDSSITLFGTTWPTPIVIAPCSSQKAFHPDGESAVARAARARQHLQILSTLTTTSVEDVTAARGAPVWYQLYPTDDWSVGRALVKRAEAAGCPVLVLTVDLQAGSNRETLARAERLDSRDCSACHEPGLQGRLRRKPMFDGLDVGRVADIGMPDMTWDFLAKLRDTTAMKIVVKGLVAREDAEIAVARGADGIVVSNHGGRAEESGRSSIESLPEVLEGAAGRVPVLIDGGFRRGTDIFKALALGATAVCVGRPYLWGLAAFGQPGVERVLEILTDELKLVMAQAGAASVSRITRAHIVGA